MKKAEATRLTILQKAFEMIYENGYQSTSVDDILATTKVTKGAFYYHFKNKDEMGMAIIDELLKPTLASSFMEEPGGRVDVVDAIYKMVEHLLMKNKMLKPEFGCPVSNFTQEMSPWNKEFSNALNGITEQWLKVMSVSIEKGKKNGTIRREVNAKQVSLFVMSGYWGIRNFGKLETERKVYSVYLRELKGYLEGLRA